MFNDKLQPIYDGKVLVNQSAMDNPIVQTALAEMSKRNFEPQRINNYGIWYISDRHKCYEIYPFTNKTLLTSSMTL